MNHVLHILVSFILTLFKQSAKINKYLLKYNKKFGTVTKRKLVTKIKKRNQLYFGTLVLTLF